MKTNKDGHQTQTFYVKNGHVTEIVCCRGQYIIAQVKNGKAQWWNGKTRAFGPFFGCSLYKTSRLAENVAATIDFTSERLNEPFPGIFRETDA